MERGEEDEAEAHELAEARREYKERESALQAMTDRETPLLIHALVLLKGVLQRTPVGFFSEGRVEGDLRGLL